MKKILVVLILLILVSGLIFISWNKTKESITPKTEELINPELSKVVLDEKIRYKEVIYDTQEGLELPISIIIPDTGNDNPKPVLLFFNAAGNSFFAKELSGFEASMFNEGYIIAKAGVRYFEDTSKFPDAYVDGKTVVRFLKANAELYEVDSDKILVTGSSKNGLIANFVGVTGDREEFEGDAYSEFDSSVGGIINFAGHTDLGEFYEDGMADSQVDMDAEGYIAKNWQFVNCEAFTPECDLREVEASAITYVDANDPPTYLFLGSEDTLVPEIQLTKMRDALQAVGVPTVYENIEGAPHGVMKFLEDEHVARIVAFFSEELNIPRINEQTFDEVDVEEDFFTGEIFMPEGISEAALFLFHGTGGSSQGVIKKTQDLIDEAIAQGYIVVAFNGRTPYCEKPQFKLDDFTKVRKMIEDLTTTYGVETYYTYGISQGGVYAMAVSQEFGFDAVVVDSGNHPLQEFPHEPNQCFPKSNSGAIIPELVGDVLLICGEEDTKFCGRQEEIVNQHPEVQSIVVPNSGHGSHMIPEIYEIFGLV